MFLYIFFNNQKLLILFNEIDVIGGKSLVKPWLNMILGKLSPRKMAPSPNSNAKPKPNPDSDREQFSSRAIFLSFIDNSFEERRKILRGEQLEKSIINIKLI